MSPKKCPRKVTQKCPRNVTQEEDFLWTKVFTKCHQKCPQDVTSFVHKMSPIMSTRCLPLLSGQQGEESMIWDKMSCINCWMVKSNLVISPYKIGTSASMIILLRVASANFSHLNFSASAGLLTVESSSLSLLIISCSCIKINYSILKCVRFNAKPFKIRTCLLIEHGFHEFPIPKI